MRIHHDPPQYNRALRTEGKLYPIWTEGYAATGEHGRRQLVCTVPGKNFADAVMNAHQAGKFAGFGDLSEHDGRFYLWGCQLFDNEEDARKRYG